MQLGDAPHTGARKTETVRLALAFTESEDGWLRVAGKAHFSPHSVNVAGVRHQVVGRGDAATGIRDADALRKALADGIRDGIARAPGAARRAAR